MTDTELYNKALKIKASCKTKEHRRVFNRWLFLARKKSLRNHNFKTWVRLYSMSTIEG